MNKRLIIGFLIVGLIVLSGCQVKTQEKSETTAQSLSEEETQSSDYEELINSYVHKDCAPSDEIATEKDPCIPLMKAFAECQEKDGLDEYDPIINDICLKLYTTMRDCVDTPPCEVV